MEISRIDVLSYNYGFFETDCENIIHKKSLPVLSVVQSEKGSYDIALDGGKSYSTGENGVFIAPANSFQEITHHNDSILKKMRAQWLFLDVLINNKHHIDGILKFPVIMPREYNEKIRQILKEISYKKGICNDLCNIYKLIDILLTVGKETYEENSEIELVKQYIENNYQRKINLSEIAGILHMSVSGTYQFFRKYLKKSPSNYINMVRINHACIELSDNDISIKQIAQKVGISDTVYFSKLFKSIYGVSPQNFRRTNMYRL